MTSAASATPTPPWPNASLDAFLASSREPALLPDLPIVDAHHHFFDWSGDATRPHVPARATSFGRAAGLPAYGAENLLADAAGLRVVATVHVEVRPKDPVAETATCARVHASRAGAAPLLCRGIVAALDLRLPVAEIDAVVDEYRAAIARENILGASSSSSSPGARLSGFRFLAQFHDGMFNTTPGVLLQADVARGARRAGELGFPVDVFVYHSQLADVASLARSVPTTTFVLDHCGGPVLVGGGAGEGAGAGAVLRLWREDVLELAALPNVVVKLGGLAMAFCLGHARARDEDGGFSSEELARAMEPWLVPLLRAFPRRAMFESNFPMDKASVAYSTLWNAFVRVAAAAALEEEDAREAFFGCANRVYALGLEVPPAREFRVGMAWADVGSSRFNN